MGTSIYYRSLRAVSDNERVAIEAAAGSAQAARTWLSCEPVTFYPGEGGYLQGGSKPNFDPDQSDVAAAAESGLPDGTVLDLIEVLSQISRDHRVDWEIVFEQGPPVGFIRNGHCDQDVLMGAEQLAEVARTMAGMSQ
jgi:hypothetical protein